jgi:hypothetical protein
MHRLTTFRSTTDHIYDYGPIRLYHNITIYYIIMLYNTTQHNTTQNLTELNCTVLYCTDTILYLYYTNTTLLLNSEHSTHKRRFYPQVTTFFPLLDPNIGQRSLCLILFVSCSLAVLDPKVPRYTRANVQFLCSSFTFNTKKQERLEEKEASVKQQSAPHSAAPSLTGCILSLVI